MQMYIAQIMKRFPLGWAIQVLSIYRKGLYIFTLGRKCTHVKYSSYKLKRKNIKIIASAIRGPSQYKDVVLPVYGNSHYKDKTVMSLSYLYNENTIP